jgi:hypothetical protein
VGTCGAKRYGEGLGVGVIKEMEKQEELMGIANKSFYGAILAAILVVVMLIGVLYLGTQRSKMDRNVNLAMHGQQPLAADDPSTIPNVIKNSSIKVVALICVFALVVGVIGMVYLAFKNGTLGELSLASFIMLGLVGGAVYIVFRVFESAFTITQENADTFPTAVYNAVVSIQANLTGALALAVIYAGTAYLSYVSTIAKLPKDFKLLQSVRREFEESTQSFRQRAASSAPPVEGGFINHEGLAALRARALHHPA